MIFADKLIQLRKKSGWSQEELAEQLGVTRQSVSKWEGAQAVPDLEKLLRLSELFGVSMDYLLKDNIETAENMAPVEETSSTRRVSMEEASSFLRIREAAARPVAYATLLCILSPICLLILGAACEIPAYGLAENVAAGIGMVVLLVIVAAAVGIFISVGMKSAPFEYLEKEIFETEYGVSGMVKERREKFKNNYVRNNIIGACLCVLSMIPLFAGAAINDRDDLFLVFMLCLTLILAGIGVVFLVKVGVIQASFEKLLQEGDYTRRNKKNSPILATVTAVYWLIVTAAFLVYVFLAKEIFFKSDSHGIYNYSWILWAVAGVLYPAVVVVTKALINRKAEA